MATRSTALPDQCGKGCFDGTQLTEPLADVAELVAGKLLGLEAMRTIVQPEQSPISSRLKPRRWADLMNLRRATSGLP